MPTGPIARAGTAPRRGDARSFLVGGPRTGRRGRGMRVLIAEDEAVAAMAPADGLQGAGHEVAGPAATMAEAPASCEAAAAPPGLAVFGIDLRASPGIE